uniref:LVIVD repeat-containing protein n=2 Tax=Streptomyces TaxID=1883 RepID=UPI000AED70B5
DPDKPRAVETTGCHDITSYPRLKLAAGACMGDGILLDIRNPAKPRVIDRVEDTENFAFWHSATFSQDGAKVVFTDELGGGGAPTCNAETGDQKGADGIYDIKGKGDKRKLVFRSYFKIPRHQAETENCVAHNGSLIPAKGRDIMVQAWYQGGVSVWDFTDSDKPREIAYFERGPLSTTSLVTGGSWSAYYYNGHIYSNDMAKGFDVLRLDDRRTDSAAKVRMRELNVQTQPDYR